MPVSPGDVLTIRVGGSVDFIGSGDGSVSAQNPANSGGSSCTNQGGSGDGGGANGSNGGTGGGGSSLLKNGVEVMRSAGGSATHGCTQ